MTYKEQEDKEHPKAQEATPCVVCDKNDQLAELQRRVAFLESTITFLQKEGSRNRGR